MTMAGIILVSAADIFGTTLVMRAEAARQAAAQEETNMRVAWNLLRAGGEIREIGGQLRSGDRPIDGDEALVDQVKALVGGAATVFHGDARVATNVVKPDGTRGVGTRLAPGLVHDAVFRDGRPYRGEAEVLGMSYLVAYDPIVEKGGGVVGALFVGVPKAEFFASVDAFERQAILAGIVVALIVGAAMLWAMRRLFSPLDGLRRAMERLAEGNNVDAIEGAGRPDDIGGMARAVVAFQESAVERHRLEVDAVSAGRLTEAERARTAADLAEAAARQGHVVDLVASALSRLSGGDLAHRIDEVFPTEYERLRWDFNGATARLQDTMRTVAASATAIRSGTGEISAASDNLSHRTEQQAASLEETAAALDEVTATVRRTAEGAKHARAVVGNARVGAERSGRVMQQAVDAMAGIERSSREIGQIIGVIDEIAFQTSLLALNAGVEAARAGDAGRGFAVVASEVRALAQRSAEAAKEIKTLVTISGQQVEQGVTSVGQTGEVLQAIVAQVAEIDGIVGEITSSAQEQATGIEAVNTAVNQMDQATQQNAAMVEESTASSHALAREAAELTRLIGEFRLGGDAEAPRRGPTATVPFARRPVGVTVSALRTTGSGGVARAPAPAADADWVDF